MAGPDQESRRTPSEAKSEWDEPTQPSVVTPGKLARSASLKGPGLGLVSGLVQRKPSGTDASPDGVSPHAERAVEEAAASGGQPLPGSVRRKFEESLGTDLSGVRVHTSSASADAASALGAKAYTVGNDIHVGAGHYDPSSHDGQHLIAHEVAHTVQQRGGSPIRQNKLEVSSPDDAFESEADRAADAIVSGTRAHVGGATSLGRVVRRKIGGGMTGGGKVSGKGASLNIPLTLIIPVKTTYVDLELNFTGTLAGNLDWSERFKSDDPEVEVGGGGAKSNDGSHKQGVEGGIDISEQELQSAKDTAANEGKEEARKSWVDGYLPDGDWKLTQTMKLGAEEEHEVDKNGKAEDKSSVKVGYVVSLAGKFKNGCTASASLRVFSIGSQDGKATGQVVGFSLGGTAPPVPIEERSIGKGLKFSGTVQSSAQVSATPNWGAIWRGIVKGGGKAAVEAAEKTAVEAAEAGVGIEAAGALFSVALFVGVAGSTLYALYQGAKQLEDVNALEKLCNEAADSYTAGVMSVLGVTGGQTKAPYFQQGNGFGAGKLTTLVNKALELPSVKAANLTAEDVMGAIRGAAQKHEAELRSAIRGRAHEQIGHELVKQYHAAHKDDWFYKQSDAQAAAHRMGLEDGHDVDLGDKPSP